MSTAAVRDDEDDDDDGNDKDDEATAISQDGNGNCDGELLDSNSDSAGSEGGARGDDCGSGSVFTACLLITATTASKSSQANMRSAVTGTRT